MTTPTTVQLVENLLSSADTVPTSALKAANRLLVDFYGVAIAGANTDEGRIVVEVMGRLMNSGGPCPVPLSDLRFDPATAALISGTMGYSIGLGDTHAPSITHPGCSVIPAALSVGLVVGASGRDILTAIVLGVEAVTRVGAAVNPSHRQRGFHPTATCNPFGAALAASYLLGSDQERTSWSLGLVGSMAGGLYEFRRAGSMLMALHGGWPAHSGVNAAFLAAGGFSGPTTVLEGPEGFLQAFADEVDANQLHRERGDKWQIEDVSLRPYNACRYAHTAIDALTLLSLEHGKIDYQEIDRLTIWTHRTAVDQETEPTTLVSARLCTRFNVAMAAMYGARLAEVTSSDLENPTLRALTARIVVKEDPELTALFPDRWACRVRVELKSGETLEQRVDIPKGDPANPLSDSEVDDKFMQLASPALGVANSTEMLAGLHDFVRLQNFADHAYMVGSIHSVEEH